MMERNGSYSNPGPLTGILDQDASIEARLWFEQEVMRLARRHRRRVARQRKRFHVFFLTVVTAAGVFAPGRLKDTDLDKLRKVMQRYARALPEGSFFGGMLEPDYVIDHIAGVKHWQWHGHFIVVMPWPGRRAAAAKRVHEAFPTKANTYLGIYRPVEAENVRIRRGGMRGVAKYASKALQVHGLHRKVVTVDTQTGKRRTAKYHLQPKQLAEWADFASGITADSLMVWSGYRRYGDRLRPTSGHGGGGRRERLER